VVRACLRAGDAVALDYVKTKRLNQCTAAQFTDFEKKSVLVRLNEQWKACALGLGDFDMDELKKDILSADAKANDSAVA
jgi:hypothetical protein